MKVVIAIDSFKGSMSSMEAGLAAREGILRACDAEVVVKPLADGGEGTTEALIEGLGGKLVFQEVTGPIGKKTTVKYGILQDGITAVMEMAEAAGIMLVKREELNPWKTVTTGVGEMILDAVNRGCRKFIIGIGGSATTEGGIGMLQALGYEFFDKYGNLLPPYFDSLDKVAKISSEKVPKELLQCHFQIACDVKNPLCGRMGAVCVFGAQKGVKEEEKVLMDKKLQHFADITEQFTGHDNRMQKGAGAAGGLGFAFLSYLPDTELKPGIEIVLQMIELEKEIMDSDIVITGEGRLDIQTAMGKAPVGVAHLAKKYNNMVIAFAGGVTEDAGKCNEEGIDAFFSIVRGIITLDEAMHTQNAKRNMSLAVEQVFRLLSIKMNA